MLSPDPEVTAMDAILTALGEQHAALDALLTPLDDAGWARPTRCEGWDVADVVLHLSQTDHLALASAQGRFDDGLAVLADGVEQQRNVDDGAAALVERARGQANAALLGQWREGAEALRAALARSDPHRRVTWVAGQLSVHTLTATRLAECWIHTGDVAEAVGVAQEPTAALEHVARLAWRMLPYAFTRDGRDLSGPVEFDLVGPDGAPWHFVPVEPPVTVIAGPGVDLCLVAARRVPPSATQLRATGPDAEAVLDLVRTYA